MRHRILALLICAASVSLLPSTSSWAAGPTNDAPNNLLEVRPEKESSDLLQSAQHLYAAALVEVAQHEQNLNDKRYAKANKRDADRLAATSLKVLQLDRLAKRLELMSETAGIDLQFRQQTLSARLGVVLSAYRTSEGINQLAYQAVQTLKASSDRHVRTLPRIETFVKQDKPELAEKALDEIYDDLHGPALFQNAGISAQYLSPFATLQNDVGLQMTALRKAQTGEQLAAERAKALPRYEAINNLVAAAVESAKTTGQANWAGKMLNGPALIDAWADGWRKTNVKLLQCYALDRLREIPVGATPASELDQLLTAHAQFEQAMLNAMAEVVSADAARVSAEETPALYADYLQAIARLCAAADERIEQTMQPALDQLAQRSPEFAGQVAAYGAATRGALRWRKRTAAAYARRYEQDAQSMTKLIEETSQAAAFKERDAKIGPSIAELKCAAPALMRDVAEVVVGRPTYVSHISPQTDGPALSRMELPCYARVPATALASAEIAELKHDLLVAEGSPPLTLAAAIAIQSAEAGYFHAVGGETVGLELQPLLVHFVRNRSDAHVPLGGAPELSRATVRELLWQVDLKPTWLQHEYVFVTVP